ncbi:MAG: hypothetical protein ACD_26C00034G0019 [uncultured bacterium]|nr:MAG: hypothetical protein ACD_26C00034G0019 [uncultured bacterium]
MILIVLIVVHILILLNLRFTAWPEMFSFPYFFNNGFSLYKDMIHPYTPLLTIFLANLYRLIGYNVWIIKLVTYTLIIINDILIFKITSKLTKSTKWGIFAVVAYLLTQPFLEGNQLWFDFAISSPILLGLWLVINKKYFWSGIVFAISFLIKQNSALFLILGLLLSFKNKNYPKILLGSFLTIIPFGIYLHQKNSIVDFFNWVLIYPSKYWTNFPDYVQMMPTNRQLLILLLLFLPTVYLVIKNKFKNNLLLFGSLIISLILIYPRFSFFHFQTGIAILAIIFGVATSIAKRQFVYLYLFIVFLILPKDWSNLTRFIDDNNLSILKNEKVYLLGPHSLNYVVSNSLPPKPWIDNYGWYFEMPGMQQRVLESWKNNPPNYVYRSLPQSGNWYDLGVYQPKEVVKYIEDNYQKVDQQNDVEVWKLK